MTESNLADMFAEEPPDGTYLVAWEDGEAALVWRNDAEAKQWDAEPDEHWFNDQHDPMTLHNILAGATQVHAVVSLNQSGLRLIGD